MKQNIFLNHTNHPSRDWCDLQIQAALEYGEIIDLPFPQISPRMNRDEVLKLVKITGEDILKINPNAVLCQGEFTYTFLLTEFLKSHGILTLAATTERHITEVKSKSGTVQKVSVFDFVMFREY